MERQITAYADFRGGMNLDVTPHLLSNTELLLAQNVDLGERGALKTRLGAVPYNGTAYGGPVTQLFEWNRINGDVWLMAVIGKSLKRIEGESSTVEIGPVSSESIGYVAFKTKLYFVDGSNFYEVSDSSVSVVTPYNDQTNDLTPIKRCTMLVRHPKSMRFFAAGDPENVSSLYYSEPNEPDFWKGTSVLVPTEGEGAIQAVTLLADAVLVFFSRSIWVWRGIDPDEDVIWEKLSAPEGTTAPKGVVLTPMSLTFLGGGGLWAMSPSALGLTGAVETSGQVFHNLLDQKGLTLLDKIDRTSFSSVYDSHKQRLIFAYDEEGGRKVAELDWPLQALTVWEGVPALCLLSTHDRKLLAGYDDYIVTLETGVFDYRDGFSYPINLQVHTPPYNPAPMQPKKFHYVFITFKSDDLDLLCDIVIDGKVFKTVDLAEYTEAPELGLDWGDSVVARIPVNKSGHGIQLKFNSNKPITLYSWAFEWSALMRKGVQI